MIEIFNLMDLSTNDHACPQNAVKKTVWTYVVCNNDPTGSVTGLQSMSFAIKHLLLPVSSDNSSLKASTLKICSECKKRTCSDRIHQLCLRAAWLSHSKSVGVSGRLMQGVVLPWWTKCCIMSEPLWLSRDGKSQIYSVRLVLISCFVNARKIKKINTTQERS